MRPSFRRGQWESYSPGLLGELAQAAVLFGRNRIQNENVVFCIIVCCFLDPRLVGIFHFFLKSPYMVIPPTILAIAPKETWTLSHWFIYDSQEF